MLGTVLPRYRKEVYRPYTSRSLPSLYLYASEHEWPAKKPHLLIEKAIGATKVGVIPPRAFVLGGHLPPALYVKEGSVRRWFRLLVLE